MKRVFFLLNGAFAMVIYGINMYTLRHLLSYYPNSLNIPHYPVVVIWKCIILK